MNKKLFGLLAAASLGISGCGTEGGNNNNPAGNAEAPVVALVAGKAGSRYVNSLTNMASTYRQAADAREGQERQTYFDRNTLLVSDGKTVMVQPASMQEHFNFTPKYLVEIRVNEPGGPRGNYSEHTLFFCEVDKGGVAGAVDRMRHYDSLEEGQCGSDPQSTKLALPGQFRDALLHIKACLPAIASYAVEKQVPGGSSTPLSEDLKTQCQDFRALRL